MTDSKGASDFDFWLCESNDSFVRELVLRDKGSSFYSKHLNDRPGIFEEDRGEFNVEGFYNIDWKDDKYYLYIGDTLVGGVIGDLWSDDSVIIVDSQGQHWRYYRKA
ncbi:MAG: hypothetical protein ABEH43_09950 [Flavobacteriales bacterium]